MANRITTDTSSTVKYDIDFCSWDGSDGVSGVAKFSFGDISKKSTGLVKAVNRYIKILLTRKGSDPFFPDLGTYLDDVKFRGGDSTTDIGTFIADQMSNALIQLQSIQANNNFPENENIITASLLNVDRISVDRIRIDIQIISEAGTGTNITVPLIGG
jgi:hypothetical protein